MKENIRINQLIYYSRGKNKELSLILQFIKHHPYFQGERKKIYNRKEYPDIKILATLNKTSSKNKFLEFIEIIKVMFYFLIQLNVNRLYYKNNILLEKKDLNTEEEKKLEVIIKNHKNS